MPPAIESLTRFCIELLGLTVVMAAVVVIAAFTYFGGFSSPVAQGSVLFCVLALLASVLPVQVYVVLRIGKLKTENAKLFHVATRDGLTQVLNRTAFKQSAQAQISAIGQRRAGDVLPHTLLILDADHFKRINDRLGHHTGDEALTAIAATLRRSVRKDDLVGRLGGEEFAILLRNAGYEEAQIVAERLRAAINMLEVGPRHQRTRLSVSLGGISFKSAVAFDALYKIADANLYRAKSGGRNRVDLTQLGSLGKSRPLAGKPPLLAQSRTDGRDEQPRRRIA